ncbi:MAG: aldehyde dehydrogenase family protein [Patescibacteria group bacterium]
MTKLVSTNPGKNYKKLGEVNISTKDDIRNKVKKANLAKREWKDLGVDERVRFIRRVVDKLKENKEELALLATQEMGIPISQSRNDVDDAIRYFIWYLDNAKKYLSPEIVYQDDKITHKVFYEPLGVAAVIIPWNFPLSNFVWGCGQNLISGNTVVLKHSEECPLFGKRLEELIESCGLPDGVFSEVYGDGKIGDYLVHQDIGLISFTGSTKVGKHLYKVAGEKFIKIVSEMGGSAPGIIFEDADLEKALETTYYNRFSNCGQACDALKRLIVHESKFAQVAQELKELLSSKKIGDSEKESTDIGPLVAKRQLELLELQVKDAIDKGAKILIGGRRPKNLHGAYYEPTILTNVNRKMRVWQEEVFGPVLPIVSFKTEEEAISLANDTKYGLGAYIFTEDKEKALCVASQIDAGMVGINNASYLQPCSPFGGYKDSGIGREHGKFGFNELTQVKVVAF